MKHFKHLFLGLALLSVAGCETMSNIKADLKEANIGRPDLVASFNEDKSAKYLGHNSCPKVEIVEELSALSEFRRPAKPRDSDLISQVTMTGIESRCAYARKSVTVDLKLAFEGQLGVRAASQNKASPFFSYPFFIAVTAPGGTILAKEVFAASMTYKSGEDTQTYYESLRQLIPVPSKSRGKRYKILIGFQLSPEQLAYNRALMKPVPVPVPAPSPPKPSLSQQDKTKI